MELKKYESDVCLAMFVDGKMIEFSPIININTSTIPARYQTKNEKIQKAIENHPFFGDRIRLVETISFKEPVVETAEDVVETTEEGVEETAMEDVEIENTSEEVEKTKEVIVVAEVTTMKEAIDYIVKKYNVKAGSVSTKGKLKNAMAKHNIEFPNLEL